ncbi:hypothetical protein D3C72_1362390 [compost metagenome]
MKSADTQPHRGLLIIGIDDLFPLRGVGLLDTFQKPAWMQIAAVIIGSALQQLFLLSLELAQYTVDQPFKLRPFQRDGAFYRFRQHCMSWDAGIQQLVEADHQQIVQRALFAGHWLGHQLLNTPFQLRQHAQGAEA